MESIRGISCFRTCCYWKIIHFLPLGKNNSKYLMFYSLHNSLLFTFYPSHRVYLLKSIFFNELLEKVLVLDDVCVYVCLLYKVEKSISLNERQREKLTMPITSLCCLGGYVGAAGPGVAPSRGGNICSIVRLFFPTCTCNKASSNLHIKLAGSRALLISAIITATVLRL